MAASTTIKLNAHLAVDSRRRKAAHETITNLHKQTQSAQLMTGLTKTYTPTQDDGQPFPPEVKRVQIRVQDALAKVGEALTDLLNTTAIKDFTNMIAKADVVVDGKILLEGAPVTYLLFLEKELRDLRTFVEKFFELDAASEWVFNPNTGLHQTPPVTTQKTAKIQEAVVVVQATDKFPAQVKDQTRDVVIGNWTIVNHSGGMSASQKEKLLRRITKLEEAVKNARERANLVEIVEVSPGQALMKFLLDDA